MDKSKLIELNINKKRYVLMDYDTFLDLAEDELEITNPEIIAALTEPVDLSKAFALEEVMNKYVTLANAQVINKHAYVLKDSPNYKIRRKLTKVRHINKTKN